MDKKKVLIVNTYPSSGGAAIAAIRMAEAVRQYSNHEVSVLTLHPPKRLDKKNINIDSIIKNGKTNYLERFNFFAERLQIFLSNGFHKGKIFHISTALFGYDISKHPLVLEADIIHLHWICQGMLSLKGLDNLSKLNKKIFWTLHDMWPITAVSPHLPNPNIYISPWEYKEKKLVATVWNRKRSIYPKLNPTFIACSDWIKGKAEESYLAKNLEIYTVPNPIDTNLYVGGEKNYSTIFEIIFGAVNVADERKGFFKIVEALEYLYKNDAFNKYNLKVSTFGLLTDSARKILSKYNVCELGYISDENKMIELYQKAHCLVVPSLYENLPNIIMEAMSCATPTIAYNIGGIPEMVIHNITGLISPNPFEKGNDNPSLAENIITLAKMYKNNRPEYVKMCNNCRTKAIENYSMEIVAKHISDLYNK